MPETTTTWMPRSGFEQVGGFVWLPRLLDKARRARTGDLGEYVSLNRGGMDGIWLRRLKVSPDSIRAWVAEGLDDGAIAERLGEACGMDRAAREQFSRRFVGMLGAVFAMIDAEEGRRPFTFGLRLVRAILNLLP